MQMYDPPHPGEIIRQDCLEPLHLTVTAAWLGVSRQSLSELLNGHNGLSAEMAIRLEKAGWSNAETWPGIRLAHDFGNTNRWMLGQKCLDLHGGGRKHAGSAREDAER